MDRISDLTLEEQLAMSSSASSSEESDSNLSSDTFSGGNTTRDRNMAKVIQHVIEKSNDLGVGNENQGKSLVAAPGVKMRHLNYHTKLPSNSSHFVPSANVKSQSKASPIVNSNKWIPVPLASPALALASSTPTQDSPTVPIVEYSHSLETLAAENSDVPVNTQLIDNILEEPSMPTPTPSPALTNDTPTNLIIDEGGESPASGQGNTEPVTLTQMSSCSIIESSQPGKPEVKLVGATEIAPPQETATVSPQETDIGPQSEAIPVKVKKRPALPIDEVSKEARRYALKWGFNVEKTISHWKKQEVKSSEFVKNTGNKKGKANYCFPTSTSRHPPNPDKYGAQRQEYFQVIMKDGNMVSLENKQFTRHPLNCPPEDYTIGSKVIIPEPSEQLKNINDGLTFGSVVERSYDFIQQKWFYIIRWNTAVYRNLEVPECRVFERFPEARKFNKEIIIAKGYTETSITKFKPGNIINIDNDVMVMVALKFDINGSYICFPIDDYGRLLYYDKNHVLVVYYEQIAPSDKLQKELFKLGRFPTDEFSNDYTELLDSQKGLKIEDKLKLPTTAEKVTYNRLLTEISVYGTADKLTDEKRQTYNSLKEKFDVGNDSFESRISGLSPGNPQTPLTPTSDSQALTQRSAGLAKIIESAMNQSKVTPTLSICPMVPINLPGAPMPPEPAVPEKQQIVPPLVLHLRHPEANPNTGDNHDGWKAEQVNQELAAPEEEEDQESISLIEQLALEINMDATELIEHLRNSYVLNESVENEIDETEHLAEQRAIAERQEAAEAAIRRSQEAAEAAVRERKEADERLAQEHSAEKERSQNELNQLAARIDHLNQKIRQFEAERDKHDKDDATLCSKIAKNVTKCIDDSLAQYDEKADKKFAKIADMPKAGKKLMSMVMKHVWSMLEDTFFEFLMQAGIAKRFTDRDHVPPEGFEDFATDYANIDLDSVRQVAPNDRPDRSTRVRFLIPVNRTVDRTQPSSSSNEQNANEERMNFDDSNQLNEELNELLEAGNDQTGPTTTRAQTNPLAQDDHPEFSERKKSLIRKVMRQATYPVHRETLNELNETTLQSIYEACYPNDGYERPGPVRHDGTPRSPMPGPMINPDFPTPTASIELLSPANPINRGLSPRVVIERSITPLMEQIGGTSEQPIGDVIVNRRVGRVDPDPDFRPDFEEIHRQFQRCDGQFARIRAIIDHVNELEAETRDYRGDPTSPEPTSPAFSNDGRPSIDTYTATQLDQMPNRPLLRSEGSPPVPPPRPSMNSAPEARRVLTPLWSPLRELDFPERVGNAPRMATRVVDIDEESDQGSNQQQGAINNNAPTTSSARAGGVAASARVESRTRDSLTDDSDSVASTPVRGRIRILLKRKERYETRLSTVNRDLEQLERMGLTDSIRIMQNERARVERMLRNCNNDLANVGRAESEIPRENPPRRTPQLATSQSKKPKGANDNPFRGKKVAKKVIYPSSSSDDTPEEFNRGNESVGNAREQNQPAGTSRSGQNEPAGTSRSGQNEPTGTSRSGQNQVQSAETKNKKRKNAEQINKINNKKLKLGQTTSAERVPTERAANDRISSLLENPRISDLFVRHPLGTAANPVRLGDEGGSRQAQTPQQRRTPNAGRSSNIDDGRDEDSMADSDAAAEEEINLNIPLSEERPTVAMRLLNAALLEKERQMAETDKRAKRSNARNSLPENDPERIADRAANFFWRLANAYINGRQTMMERLNTIVDNLIADDRNPRLQERTFTNLYFRGIFHWMLIYFPVQDSRDTRLYIRRIKFKLKNNINSDRSRQRKKDQNEPRRDESGAGAE